MNYIYDVTLNFNKDLYNFYEWEVNDNIDFYLKIPIFKIEEQVMNDLIISNFNVDKHFLNKIYNKTEIYGKKGVLHNKYSCVLASETKVFAVMFDENGDSYKKSYMSIDEENDVLEFSKFIKYTIINYKIKSKVKNNDFITRNELETKHALLKELNRIYKEKQYDKLEYIFYEIYNERNNNESKMYSKLLNLIENNSEKIYKIKNFFSSIKKEEKIV